MSSIRTQVNFKQFFNWSDISGIKYFLGAAPVPANHTCEYQAAKAAGLFYFSQDVHSKLQNCIYLRFSRSTRPGLFCKKGVLRNFTKSTGKQLCQALFFNKVEGLRPGTLLNKETLAQVFSLWWLLLETSFVPNLSFSKFNIAKMIFPTNLSSY